MAAEAVIEGLVLEAYRPTILHGRLDSEAKARLMAEFSRG